MIRVPSSIDGFSQKNYVVIESIQTGVGFSHVKCVPLQDLTIGLLNKPGLVDSITIGGKEITSGGKKFHKDAPVVITYHSLSGKQ